MQKKVKRAKDEEVNEQGRSKCGKGGIPVPRGVQALRLQMLTPFFLMSCASRRQHHQPSEEHHPAWSVGSYCQR